MAKFIKLETDYSGSKTYKTEANAIKAAQDKFGHYDDLRFVVMKNDDGRFFPVFLGEKALQYGVHFNFHVLG